MQLQEKFSQAEEIAVYKDGSRSVTFCGEEKFEELVARWNCMLEDSLVMPAFGVSINDITVKSMAEGVWTEFIFSEPSEEAGMPFERLLVEIKPMFNGFNVIRYCSELGYFGRCFYIDLRGKNMSGIYDYIISEF